MQCLQEALTAPHRAQLGIASTAERKQSSATSACIAETSYADAPMLLVPLLYSAQ
jgi:hypothetical protein